MNNKRALRFTAGYTATAFSGLGWICAGDLSQNPHIWYLVIPLVIFIVCIHTFAMITWIDEDNNADK